MPDVTLETPSSTRQTRLALSSLQNWEQAVDSLQLEEEPGWLMECRRQAWEKFKELPYPGRKDDFWRFATIQRNFLDAFHIGGAMDSKTREAICERSHLIGDGAGQILFGDGSLIDQQVLPESLKKQGVIFQPMTHALETHGELLESVYQRMGQNLGGAKFEALNQAFSREGVLLYIPKGVIIEEPFITYHWLSRNQTAVFPRTIVLAEEQSQVNCVECFFSTDGEASGLAIAKTQIFAGPGSRVFRKVIQDWNENTLSFQHDCTYAQRDAQVKNVAINIGSKRARYENQVRIEGPGADVKLYSLTIAEKEQEFDQRTLQVHAAPHSVSDLLYKNALLDQSKTIFSGLIKVEKDAQQTDAYQTNRNLLLDSSAEANSLPGLEIEANDVKCSHGATTSKLDPEELFYLQSRGLSRQVATQLLVFGFFEEIINQIDNEDLADNVRALVHAKFNQHRRI